MSQPRVFLGFGWKIGRIWGRIRQKWRETARIKEIERENRDLGGQIKKEFEREI